MAAKERIKLAGPTRPLGSPEIPQFHLPPLASAGKGMVYAPRLFGAAQVAFKVGDGKRRAEEIRAMSFLLTLEPTARTIDWDAARQTEVTPEQLLAKPPVQAAYLPLAPRATDLKTFTRWAKTFDRWLARTQRLTLPAKPDATEPNVLLPKRGGVRVQLVAIVWELVEPT